MQSILEKCDYFPGNSDRNKILLFNDETIRSVPVTNEKNWFWGWYFSFFSKLKELCSCDIRKKSFFLVQKSSS